MKAKTKKRLQQALFYFIIAVFVAGLLLAYLPVTQPAPQATPVPLNDVPQVNQDAPGVGVTAAPAQ